MAKVYVVERWERHAEEKEILSKAHSTIEAAKAAALVDFESFRGKVNDPRIKLGDWTNLDMENMVSFISCGSDDPDEDWLVAQWTVYGLDLD